MRKRTCRIPRGEPKGLSEKHMFTVFSSKNVELKRKCLRSVNVIVRIWSRHLGPVLKSGQSCTLH